MPFVTEAQLLDSLEAAMGAEGAAVCLKEVLSELGLPSKQLFRPEEAAAIGEAVMGRAARILHPPLAQLGGAGWSTKSRASVASACPMSP